MTASPDPLVFARNYTLAHQAGTAIADWPIRDDRGEQGDKPPFLVLEDGGGIRDALMPAWAPYRVRVRAYGNTEEEAAAGMRAMSDLFHRLGPVTTADGTLFQAFDELGVQIGQEPGIDWPFAFGVIDLYIADQ